MKIINRPARLKLLFSPELVQDEGCWNWALLSREERHRDLIHTITNPDPYKPKRLTRIPVDLYNDDRKARSDFLECELREGVYQQKLRDTGMVRVNLDIIDIPSGKGSSIEGTGLALYAET